MKEILHFIDGVEVSAPGERAQVFNPANGQAESQVCLGSQEVANAAVAAAHKAWPEWAGTPALRRTRILDAFKSRLWADKYTLAHAISQEHGKTHEDALGEVTRGIEVVEFALGAPLMLKGEFSENVGRDVDSYSVRQSLGVCVGITPFNFPAMVPMWMFPVAIAAGNSFILKPSEKVPSAAVLLAKWLHEAGLPPGVFNVLHGGPAAVEALLCHRDVRAVSFVGSTPVAQIIHQTATRHHKRVQALGGAKNHMVVMPDADLDMTANALLGAAFGSAGERCMAISVVVPVTDAVADALVARLVPAIRALNIGPASNTDSQMGPLITREHVDNVRGYIDRAESDGAEVCVDGRTFQQSQSGFEGGFYLGGTLLDRVDETMECYRDEIFGPVLSIVRKESFDEAIDLVHSHQYANGVAIFTRDGDAARSFAKQVEVGMVGVNVPIPVPMAFHSFGGWKNSMYGDHHMHGPEGFRFFTRIKTTTMRWPTGLRENPEFRMPTL